MKALIYICLAPLLMYYEGCLESNVLPEFNASLENSAMLLVYFEQEGDFINTMDAPPNVEASEVYSNLESYLVLDTRSHDLFKAGHIKGAINLEAKDLASYFKQNNTGKYIKAVLISQAGQASSYYATLLRLLGYKNVYSLNFGMASWNTAFSGIWNEHTKDSPNMKSYTNAASTMNPKTSLPHLEFRTKSLDIKDMVEERVSDMLLEGFNENLTFEGTSVSGPAITVNHLFPEDLISDNYTVCYGSDALYSAVGRFNPYSGLGHPEGAISYAPYSSLKSSNYLQTLPTDRKIGLYCYNGQYSASAAAYLRLLGYDARSMLFGAHELFYSRMLYEPLLIKYAFRKDLIAEYPFVTGD
ncbi:MAG: rhodanese-like domain-containing protein [Acidobacteriota bacterium]